MMNKIFFCISSLMDICQVLSLDSAGESRIIKRRNFTDTTLCSFLCRYRLTFACNDKLQLGALISTFTTARTALVASAD
jgi:hypothetical protein